MFNLILRHDAFSFDLRSEEHTSELQSRENLVCRLLLEKNRASTWVRLDPAPVRDGKRASARIRPATRSRAAICAAGPWDPAGRREALFFKNHGPPPDPPLSPPRAPPT